MHTYLDGDVVVALTTAPARPLARTADVVVRLGAIALDVMVGAVCRGVYLADYQSYRSLYPHQQAAAPMVG